MSRNVCQPLTWPDREQQQMNREQSRLLITACPSGLIRGKSYARGEGLGQRKPIACGDSPDRDNSAPGLLAALIQQDRLVAAQVFTFGAQSRIGAVYLGKVKKVVKNLNACFVEIAQREQCFLHMGQEKVPPFLTNRVYDGRILEGDELLVQVQQEPIKSKQATVTTRITLQGEYFVFAMGKSQTGISKKLDETQKDRLRQLLVRWQAMDSEGRLAHQEGVPSFGLVARTQAGLLLEQAEEIQVSEEILRREYEQLLRQFTALFLQGQHRNCYCCLHGGGSALEEALKPFGPGEYQEVVTDLPQVQEELLGLQESGRPSLQAKQIRLYQDPALPLDRLYGLGTKLAEALGKTVWLKSGANLVVEQTESLTAIDVNTGKCIRTPGNRSMGPSSEETMRRVNLEAAREVARQLRLRNLSGIIIVDFINLATLAQEEELLQELRALVKEDPVPVKVVDMTPLGLVEITRKKVYPSLREQLARQEASCI
ncbi:MAG: ribonuclease E/G [Lachnospiraceae bacterium]|nr:ribonuclease E/G [Lachnospiraceae bacterium]